MARRRGGARLPGITRGTAWCLGVAVFPWALRDGPGAVGEQLVPQIAGQTSRAVWWKNKLRSSDLGGRGGWRGICLCICLCMNDCRRYTCVLTHVCTLTHKLTHTHPRQFNRQQSKRSRKQNNEQGHATQTITERHSGSREVKHLFVTYLNPSALGMNRLGFGGSLWQRGTLTGRGLFLGTKKKITEYNLTE